MGSWRYSGRGNGRRRRQGNYAAFTKENQLSLQLSSLVKTNCNGNGFHITKRLSKQSSKWYTPLPVLVYITTFRMRCPSSVIAVGRMGSQPITEATLLEQMKQDMLNLKSRIVCSLYFALEGTHTCTQIISHCQTESQSHGYKIVIVAPFVHTLSSIRDE